MIVSELHTKHGVYFVYFDKAHGTYGISREKVVSLHCGYASLSALFCAKGI